MKQILLPLLLALLTSTAHADYRLTLSKAGLPGPVAEAPAAPVTPLAISLNAVFLPEGWVGEAYSYDFTPLAAVTGDGAPANPVLTWSSADPLPPGLSLSAAGVLSGTPATEGTTSFTVIAAYDTVQGGQDYQITVNAPSAPVLSTITPSSGTGLTGSLITLTGSNFFEASQILVDDVVVATTYVNPTTLTFIAPTHAAGNASVRVVNGEGMSSSNMLTLVYGQEPIILTIAVDQDDYNLRTNLMDLGYAVNTPVDVKVVINSGVTVQATSVTNAAFETGMLPTGSTVDITNYGTICGKGGKGGAGQTLGGEPGQAGGPGLRAQGASVIIKNFGYIYGGGGGGGGGGGVYNTTSATSRVSGGGGGGGRSCHATSGGIAFSNSGPKPGYTNSPASHGGAGTAGAAGGQGNRGAMENGYKYIRGGYGGFGGGFGQAGASGQAGTSNIGGMTYSGGAGGAGGVPVVAANGGTVVVQQSN